MVIRRTVLCNCFGMLLALGYMGFATPALAQHEPQSTHTSEAVWADAPSFPIWSLVRLYWEDLLGYSRGQGDGLLLEQDEREDPPYTIDETDDDYIITLCTPNPENQEKEICTVFVIDKKTGEIRIIVKGYTVLDLTFHVKCNSNGICRIVDDLPGFLRTRFCTMTQNDEGKIIYDCDFKYLGFKLDTIIELYIENGSLCYKVGVKTPECVPLEVLPADLKNIWRLIKPPYLPELPLSRELLTAEHEEISIR